jgi:class 3 adenylate cyclase
MQAALATSAAADKKILVIDDESGIRNNILLMLKVERFAAVGAENGRVGLDMARSYLPNLILCDVNMPEMDGFQVLEALRADERLADTPFVFLTALDDRANQRRGMNLGADDYLTKPFTRNELMAAVTARLRKHETSSQALTTRLLSEKNALTERFRNAIAGQETVPVAEARPAPGEIAGEIAEATVLFTDIRNFTTYSELLTASEIAEFLNAYLERACAPVLACGGRILKFLGDGFLALFEPGHADSQGSHAKRALRAAVAIQLASLRFREWIELRHPSRGLPEFCSGVGVHSGEVLICKVGTSEHEELTAIGDSVNVASRLEGQTKELGWAIVASDASVAAAGAGVSIGARQHVQLRGRSTPTLVHEVTGADAGPTPDAAETVVALPQEMREALAANAQMTASAAKDALGITLRMIANDVDELARERRADSVHGYRVQSKLGQGGSSTVYLAERDADKQLVVLKILNMSSGPSQTLLHGFMREFEIISSIDHANVVKIYDRGFSEDLAYIAMEYFPGGTLAGIIAEGLTARQGLSLLAQAGAGLREIHGRGIVHRDVKPANLMARADGTIALADFGIAKHLGEDLERTHQGEVFGTPYYISPEQIRGEPATAQSDIYALGVMFHEMLLRRRPFEAEGVADLMRLHTTAERPRLPEQLADYQALLDGMLAIDPRERFASADALLHAIDEVWTRQALRTMRSHG